MIFRRKKRVICPADPDVRNFSFAVVDGKLYFRENSLMRPVSVSATAEQRIRGLIGIRDCVRKLIEYQTEDYPESMIHAEQANLNTLYDSFVAKYGRINSRTNVSAFSADNAYYLLSSLEVRDSEGNFLRKADMFTKRTIRQRVTITSVDTASEALALSLAEKAKVDMPYMMELTRKSEDAILSDLRGVIFLNPAHDGNEDVAHKYLPADEYLSRQCPGEAADGKIICREGRAVRRQCSVSGSGAAVDLTAGEITVRLGAAWLPRTSFRISCLNCCALRTFINGISRCITVLIPANGISRGKVWTKPTSAPTAPLAQSVSTPTESLRKR